MSILVLAAGLTVALPGVAAADGDCGPRPDIETARAAALSCGGDVEALAEHTEYDRVFAQPDGALRRESVTGPQWVKAPNGIWRDIDTTLHTGADGRPVPEATLMTVAFSGGGSDPLVSMTAGDDTFTLASPLGGLPEPQLDGDTAIYADAAPGVDLVVRATPTGFSHELVVKTPEAAASDAVREIRYPAGGTAALEPGGDGGLRLVAAGRVVATAPEAMMWDSSTLTGTGGRTAASEAEHTGDGAKTAPVEVDLAGGDMVLTPDTGLLADPDLTYPVRIDPSFSSKPSRWAYANNVNDNRGADPASASARVGADPSNGWLYRSAFTFPVTGLRGTEILDVKFTVTLYHSWSCHADPQPTYLYRSHYPDSTPRESWSNAHLGDYLGSNSVTSNKASCYSDPTPTAAWHTADLESNLVSAVQKYKTITVAMSAKSPSSGGESTQKRWKKFKQDTARLIVTYNTPPATPSGLSVGDTACAATGSGSTNDGTARLSARLTDADGDTLDGRFEYRPAGGTAQTATDADVKSGDHAAVTTAALADGDHEWRVRAQDARGYGGWSAWCAFTVDTDAPDPPAISSADYGECTAESCPADGGPGVAGGFTLTAADTDAAAFEYGWSTPPANELAVDGATADLNLTPPSYGRNILFVQTRDAAGNVSGTASYTFTVGRAGPPVSAWSLERRPGGTEALTNTVAGGEDLRTQGTVGWLDDARRIGAQTAGFRTGYLATTAPATRTDASFSVSAWARLDGRADHATVVSQAATHRPGFYLKYNATKDRWSFEIPVADAADTGYLQALSEQPPATGEWTLLTGVFDAAAGEIRLYRDGELQSTVAHPDPWHGSGRLLAGAAGDTAGRTWSLMNGAIAGVRVFDRVVVAEDFTTGSQDLRPLAAPDRVGAWSFDAGTGGTADDVSGWDRPLELSAGVTHTDGHDLDGFGLHFDGSAGAAAAAAGPVVRTDASFTVTAWARLDDRGHAATVVSQSATHRPGFALKYRPSEDRWAFETPSADIESPQHARALSTRPADLGEWIFLAGVYDAASGEISLYVGGELQSTTSHPAGWHANGPLVVGASGTAGSAATDPMRGAVDDVAVYAGALGSTRIQALFEGRPLPGD